MATLQNESLGAWVFVEMDVTVRPNSAHLTSYAVTRTDPATLTFLAAGYNGSAWRVLKYINGTATVVGSYALIEAIGTTPVMRFEVESGCSASTATMLSC